MPSPFPGMDPYLESPAAWPEVHHRLASEIGTILNGSLPKPYYARINMRLEISLDADDSTATRSSTIVADLGVAREPRLTVGAAGSGVALIEPTARAVSSRVMLPAPPRDYRHHYVEIRDARFSHQLVTLIEILSPSNKRPGVDRDAYAKKQRETLDSDANLVEIDLLRGGKRVLPDAAVAEAINAISPPADFLVFVSRSWRRGAPGYGYELYPNRLREMLPCVEIPLREEDLEVALDLQQAFDLVYDRGPFARGGVDYAGPPGVPLALEDAAWAEERLRAAGYRATKTLKS